MAPAKVVIVGGGLAGLRTAEELRAVGYGGAITLVGAEARPPYDRPPLSKKVLTGEMDDTSLRADRDSLGIDMRLAETAVGLGDGVLRTDVAEYAWDALVVATGATPVTLPGSGEQLVLRTADDALALRARLAAGTRIAIVGAGWIGAELATAAVSRGCRVTVVEAAAAPLTAALGAQVGAQTARWYAEADVDLRLQTAVAAIEPTGVALADGGWIRADLVVTAVGVRPAVAWLGDSGLRLDDGVVVDSGLRASAPGVFAVGDCASFWSHRYQRQLRVEHWDVALHSPETVAANIAGDSEDYDPVPYFWSEQFGRMVQYAGWHGGADQLVWRGSSALPRWAVCWLASGKLVAALTVGLPRDLLQARRLIAAGVRVDAVALADPGVAIRDTALE